MIEQVLEVWAKNIHRLEESAIARECGVRPYGIEYRIMLEGGVAKMPGGVVPDQLISDVDLAVTRVSRQHPEHMSAIKEYYKRGSYRAVRLVLNCSQHTSVKLVREGEDMLRGALLMLW